MTFGRLIRNPLDIKKKKIGHVPDVGGNFLRNSYYHGKVSSHCVRDYKKART